MARINNVHGNEPLRASRGKNPELGLSYVYRQATIPRVPKVLKFVCELDGPFGGD
jgi:hypothetical protein